MLCDPPLHLVSRVVHLAHGVSVPHREPPPTIGVESLHLTRDRVKAILGAESKATCNQGIKNVNFRVGIKVSGNIELSR